MFVPPEHRYTLPQSIRDKVRQIPIRFGFDIVSEITYYRTYSRTKIDKNGNKTHENWHDTVIRVVNASISFIKNHLMRNRLPWNQSYWDTISEKMVIDMARFKVMPPGRGLWGCGKLAYKVGAAVLNNCGAASTKDLIGGASWIFDLLMCGCGTGFDTEFRGEVIRPDKDDTFTFVVPDSRTGWVEAARHMLMAYIPQDGQVGKYPTFDYSLIRPAGTPMKTFGGTACGPAPLKKLLKRLEIYLDTYLDYQMLVINDYDAMINQRQVFDELSKFLEQPTKVDDMDWNEFDTMLHIMTADYQDGLWAYDRVELLEKALNFYNQQCSMNQNNDELIELAHDCQNYITTNKANALERLNVFNRLVDRSAETDYSEKNTLLDKIDEIWKKNTDKTPQQLYDLFLNILPKYNGPVKKMHKLPSTEQLRRIVIKYRDQLSDDLIQLQQDLNNWHDDQVKHKIKKVKRKMYQPWGRDQNFKKTVRLEIYLKKTYERTRLVVDIINAIGACVVAGNIRRSSQLALGLPGDQSFDSLKDWMINPERGAIAYMSNNSISFTSTDQYTKYLPSFAARTRVNGEPGYFFPLNLKYGRTGRQHNQLISNSRELEPDHAIIPNPCVTADTWIQTVQGPMQVRDLINNPIDVIVNGESYSMESNGFFSTGVRSIYEVTTKSGYKLKLTDNHPLLKTSDSSMYSTNWVEVKNLVAGDSILMSNHRDFNSWPGLGTFNEGWLIGRIIGDGGFVKDSSDSKYNSAYLHFYGSSAEEMMLTAVKIIEENIVTDGNFTCSHNSTHEIYRAQHVGLYDLCQTYGITDDKMFTTKTEQTSSEFQCGLLSGFFDADGSVHGTSEKEFSIRLAYSNVECLEIIQRMLSRLGIMSSLVLNQKVTSNSTLPDGNSDYYNELIISKDNIRIYSKVVGFYEQTKINNMINILTSHQKDSDRETFVETIQTIKIIDGEEEVYDVTISDVHEFCANGFRTHNCGEIGLEDKELCNVVEIPINRHLKPIPSNTDKTKLSLNDMFDMSGFLQACELAFIYGKSVSVLPTHVPETNAVIQRNRRIGVSLTGIAQVNDIIGSTNLIAALRAGYNTIRLTDTKISRQLGVRCSLRVTTCKPSGSVSLLSGSTPGVNYPYMRKGLRRIRISKTHWMVEKLKDAGLNWEKDLMADNTLVFDLYLDYGSVRPINEVNIWEQFTLVALLQREWADNMVSNTITFLPKNGNDLERALAAFAPMVKSIAALPHDDTVYQQAPNEPLDNVTYEKRPLYKIDWTQINDVHDMEMPRGCTNDVCLRK